jgi:RNA polymerase sigma-70 factor (ECF subfamily)
MSSWAEPVPLGSSREDARFAELYGRYFRSVHAFCRRRLASDAVDDAVAEVFLSAWRRLGDVPDGDAALVWLYGAAHRVVGNQWRGAARYRRLKTRMRTVVEQTASAADEAVLDDDACRIVLEAIARLGRSDTEVLLLLAWEQLSVAEIAVVLDIAPNAVTQRLHRARRNLGREYRGVEAQPIPPRETPTGGVR